MNYSIDKVPSLTEVTWKALSPHWTVATTLPLCERKKYSQPLKLYGNMNTVTELL